MDRKQMILIISAVLMTLILSVSAVFADSKEPDLTDVTGIRFEPAAPIELEEWIDGTLHYDEDDEIHPFRYDWYNRIIQDGNALILVNKDGTESRFVYDTDRKGFVGKDDYKIKRAKVLCTSSDTNNDAEWNIGKRQFHGWSAGDHTVSIKYKGLKCETTVTVIENSIENVEYIQHAPLAENNDGEWRTDAEGNRYYYYHYFYEDSDVIRLTWKDGSVKEYKHKAGDWDVDGDEEAEYFFTSKDGEFIKLRTYQIASDQSEHHWTLGSDNYGTFYYGGKTYQSQVTIKLKNTLKASGKTATVKYAKLKKKTQKISKAKAFKINNAKGSVTFQMAKKDKKAGNKITVSKKGVVTVKKSLKKGKYTIKVNVKAAGDDAYAPMTKAVTVKVNVR